jgi:ferredoxin
VPAAGCYQIRLLPEGDSFACRGDQHLLQALQQVGVAPRLLAAIPVGCRGGGCGVCRIRVVAGRYSTKKMSRKHISAEDEAAGIVLACRVFPESDLAIEVDEDTVRLATRQHAQGASGGLS